MKIITIISFFLISELSFGQFYIQMFPADSAMMAQDLPLAIELYQKELKEMSVPDSGRLWNNYINLSCAYTRLGIYDSTFKYLELALDIKTDATALADYDFFPVVFDLRWKEIEKKILQKISQEHPEYNISLCRPLWRMKMTDQLYYKDISRIEKMEGKLSPKIDSIFRIKAVINKENQRILDSLIEKFGFPRISKVGKLAADGAFIVIQHGSPEYMAKYVDTLKALANIGEVEKYAFAMFIDRVLVDQYKPQIYGTQIGIDSLGYNFLFPVEDPENLDKRRQEMDLVPMEMYLQFFTFRPDSLPPFEFKWPSSSQ